MEKTPENFYNEFVDLLKKYEAMTGYDYERDDRIFEVEFPSLYNNEGKCIREYTSLNNLAYLP